MSREASILMNITSLPGRYGIGCYSRETRAFVAWMKDSGQIFWQILPLRSAEEDEVSFQSGFSFAGDPDYIELEPLVAEGVLSQEECDCMNFWEEDEIPDEEERTENHNILLTMAYERTDLSTNKEYQRFAEENRWWLEDYALFLSLKHYFRGKNWHEWPENIRRRWDHALEQYRQELRFDMEFQMYLQFQFFRQYARRKGFSIRNYGYHQKQALGEVSYA